MAETASCMRGGEWFGPGLRIWNIENMKGIYWSQKSSEREKHMFLNTISSETVVENLPLAQGVITESTSVCRPGHHFGHYAQSY